MTAKNPKEEMNQDLKANSVPAPSSKRGRPKKKRERKIFTAQEKTEAVLSIWTESSSQSEICRNLGVNANSLQRWQDQAMEAILKAMEPARKEAKQNTLSPRLEKLLSRHIPHVSDQEMEP
ncbi:transposase [Lentisphaera araneosa]|uniref:transposase n=1 Tax=Lentisphaera araneosa TaxID=256847 RepID=UPI003B75C8C7